VDTSVNLIVIVDEKVDVEVGVGEDVAAN